VEEANQMAASHDERYPVLVAEVDGQVVGWSSLTRWSERPAYDDTAETSFYVHSHTADKALAPAEGIATIDEARRSAFTRSSHASPKEAPKACT